MIIENRMNQLSMLPQKQQRNEIIAAHVVQPFPFDWCTEQEFDELRYEDDKVTDEQWTIYDQWDSENYHAQDFGSAWVQTVELDQQSWRERQLKGLL